LVELASERGECVSARERRGSFVSSVLHPLLLFPLLLRLFFSFSFSSSFSSSSSSSNVFLLLYLLCFGPC
jgi:hypothetical protein